MHGGICKGDVFWTREEDRCVERLTKKEVGGIGGIDVEKGNGIASLNEDAGSRCRRLGDVKGRGRM